MHAHCCCTHASFCTCIYWTVHVCTCTWICLHVVYITWMKMILFMVVTSRSFLDFLRSCYIMKLYVVVRSIAIFFVRKRFLLFFWNVVSLFHILFLLIVVISKSNTSFYNYLNHVFKLILNLTNLRIYSL